MLEVSGHITHHSSDFRHQTSDIQHQIPVTLLTSDIGQPTPDTHHSSDFRHQTSDIQYCTPNTHHSSDIKHPTPNTEHLTPITLLISDIGHQTSDFQHRTPNTFKLSPLSNKKRPPLLRASFLMNDHHISSVYKNYGFILNQSIALLHDSWKYPHLGPQGKLSHPLEL